MSGNGNNEENGNSALATAIFCFIFAAMSLLGGILFMAGGQVDIGIIGIIGCVGGAAVGVYLLIAG